ncbi:hypothetical protein NGTWS1803_37930 [Mycolicibacterium cyprinidarum]|nr:hypothetical protein NGTWS1803_37930 [Mycolicibacterium sp. NGTWS1803]
MASDFDYTGEQNQQAGFCDKSTGVQHWVPNIEGGPVELLDGDQVVITSSGQRVIWSIREQRQVGYA